MHLSIFSPGQLRGGGGAGLPWEFELIFSPMGGEQWGIVGNSKKFDITQDPRGACNLALN